MATSPDSPRIYTIEISDSADIEADEIYLWIQQRSLEQAQRWFNGLLEAYRNLRFFPYRFVALRNQPDVRRMLYGNYRITYRVIEPSAEDEPGIVRILHVYHGARQPGSSPPGDTDDSV